METFTWVSLLVFGYGAYEWSKLAEIKGRSAQLLYSLVAIGIGAAVYEFYLQGSLWTALGNLTDKNYNLMILACVWWGISSFLVFVYPRGNRVWQHQVVVKSIFSDKVFSV